MNAYPCSISGKGQEAGENNKKKSNNRPGNRLSKLFVGKKNGVRGEKCI